MLLTDFQSIRPPFESKQEETLEWLAMAHTKAEGNEAFKDQIKERLWHVGCKPENIGKRGHVVPDFLHLNWDAMDVYKLNENKSGKTLTTRSQIYAQIVDAIFEQFYAPCNDPPTDLIHVSCTGYVSPSGAQKLISKKNWGHSTTVTHAYHMGCYGAIAALRIGQGFLNVPKKEKVDLVHTELCSLHLNPSLHGLDQLISQSLFADGFIKYSALKTTSQPHLHCINIREEIIPNSTNAMTWNMMDWGFQMSLAKEVVVHIAKHVKGFIERLGPVDLKKALFAIHPGGPKILFHIKEILQLSEIQMHHSFEILKNFGNMSSCTLPHIWEKMLLDETIPSTTPIISLAFGPGLTIAGIFMEKVCGC